MQTYSCKNNTFSFFCGNIRNLFCSNICFHIPKAFFLRKLMMLGCIKEIGNKTGKLFPPFLMINKTVFCHTSFGCTHSKLSKLAAFCPTWFFIFWNFIKHFLNVFFPILLWSRVRTPFASTKTFFCLCTFDA